MYKNNIFFVAGSKGGVGKSFLSIALLDYLMNAPVFSSSVTGLIETDETNPDVFKLYTSALNQRYATDKIHPIMTNHFRTTNDLIDLLNHLEGYNAQPNPVNVVVNCSAGTNKAAFDYLRNVTTLTDRPLEFNFHTLWIMNNQIDSCVLLEQHYESILNIGTLTVVLNEFFGGRDAFYEYLNSNVFKILQNSNGYLSTFTFPRLAQGLANMMYIKRKTIEDIMKTESLGCRVELHRWRQLVHSHFDRLFKNITEQGR